MKRLSLTMVLVLALGLALASPAAAADKPITIKLATLGIPDPFKEAGYAGMLVFKKQVEADSGGRMKVEIYPAGTLGNESDSMEAVKNGVIEMFSASQVALSRIFPAASCMASPYLFRNANVAWEVTQGEFGKKLLDAFTETTGVKGLAVLGLGFNAITNSVRPLRKPEDFKGIKFRGMGNMQVAMFESLGSSAVPISWTEVYTSLQTGVVEGQTNPPAIIHGFKIYEVQKYLTVANSQYGYQFWVANKAFYDNLSDQDKRVVRDALDQAMITSWGMASILDMQALTELVKLGMKIEGLSGEEIETLQAVARPKCLEWLRTQMDPKWVDGLLAAIGAAETKLGYK